MPIIPAKCTNCGASLEVDNTKDAAICPYCNSAFIVEKAINNYNTTNHISAETVNIYGGNGADFVIRAGTLEKYNGASTEVVIPNSVTSIGTEAFRGCTGLTGVTIPDSVTRIGWCAFSGCTGLTSITVPDSVTNIESGAFSGCTGLKSITIPDSMTSIGPGAFSGCTGLTGITIPGSVTAIGDCAFCDCAGLTSIIIPSGVTSIGHRAFDGCTGLTSITIPDSVVEIGDSAFRGCPHLKTVNASEEWKKTHWYDISCLESYKPPAPKKSGCYIATAVYGSYDCPQVWTLRRFRDNTLAKTWYGRAFVHAYYAVSPTLVRCFGSCKRFRKAWKSRLDRMVADLQEKGVESTPYDDRNW